MFEKLEINLARMHFNFDESAGPALARLNTDQAGLVYSIFWHGALFRGFGDPPVLENRLGIVRARGEGLLDHPYAPCHPPSVPPMEEHLVGHLTNYGTVIR